MSEPTHILQNSSPCIDPIFTDQPNFVINSGIKPSLHENYHHQITYAKFNLQIIPHLTRDLLGITKMPMQKALNMTDWNKLFSNANVEKQVNILNDFARSKGITTNDRDPP